MARLKKGSAAAKAWGAKMRRARRGGRKAGTKIGKKKTARGRALGRVSIGGIAYEPVSARKRRAAPKRKVAKRKGRGAKASLPYGYGGY